jgi:probable HAF family extracellular repeat protein
MPLILLVLLSLLLSPAALAAPTYSATFLPANFQAFAIDDAGRIAGGGTDQNGNTLAFIWSAGNIAFLPAPDPGGSTLVANAIENGVAAGILQSGGAMRGFIYANGTAQDTGTLYGGDTVAWGVNAAGQAVGESLDPAGNSRAFLYSGGAITDIGTLGGTYAQARDINNAGFVVGGANPGPAFPDDGSHAFLYRDGVMTDLGTLGGGFSFANAINDAGQVAGYSLTAGNMAIHPFLYSGGALLDLGSLGGDYAEARALNEAGLVVGLASLPGFGFSHAFLYADGRLQDLNALVDGLEVDGLVDFTLTEAVGINEQGQIVANGCDKLGFCAPVLLTPVPEPAAPAMWLAGLLVGLPLLSRRLRRATHRK